MADLNMLMRANGRLHFKREPLAKMLAIAFNQCQNRREFEFLKANIEGAIDVAFTFEEERWDEEEEKNEKEEPKVQSL